MSERNRSRRSALGRRAFLGTAAAGVVTLLSGRELIALDRRFSRHGAARPLGMAVIGDSIMWGQGLLEQEKYWFKTKQWLTRALRRPISHHLFAHSGARIESYAFMDTRPPLYGEIPNPSPSVVRQAQFVKNPAEIDFVLLNGGANDVVLSRVISKAATPDWIAEEMRTKCGERMRAMLCYLVGLFPNARFAVTGYYPLVSPQSFATTDAIARIFQRLYGFDWTEAINYAKGRDALLQKSYAFANESTKWLQWATNETNALFPNRVVFAKPVIDGDRCLAATDTHIWGLEADPVRALRITQCQAAGRLTLVDFDAMVEGRTSGEIFDITCAMASVMHPNAKGAQRYFEALASALPAFFPYWEV